MLARAIGKAQLRLDAPEVTLELPLPEAEGMPELLTPVGPPSSDWPERPEALSTFEALGMADPLAAPGWCCLL
jgi:hypothetical protein